MRLTPWKVFNVLTVALACVDAAVLALILNLWWLMGLAAMVCVGLVVVVALWWRRLRAAGTVPTASGWSLGKGVELTNPARPKDVFVSLQQKALDLGFLGIGSPGSGKTVSLGVGYIQYLHRGYPDRGWCIIDGKGDIDYYLSLVKAGAPPRYFVSSELPGSDSINILAGEPFDVVDRCMRFLVPTTLSTSFYSDEQRTTLMTVIPLLKKAGVAANIRDFYTVLTVEDAALELMRRAQASPQVTETDQELAKRWFASDFQERFTLNKGLINRLSVFCVGEHNDRFNVYQPDVDIGACMRDNQSVFFHLPYSEFSKDIAVAMVEMFGVEARKRQLSGPEHYQSYPLLFEDYGGFFHDNFGPISSRCRSARMPLGFTFQSLAQVQKVGQAFLGELDDNIPTKIIFRVMGGGTSRFAVELLDDFESPELSSSAMGEREGTSLHSTAKQRISIRQLRELAPGEAFVSTLLYKPDRTVSNPLYRVQFPDTEVDTSAPAALPAAKPHAEGEGLGLWSKYMSSSRLRDIQAQVQRDMIEAAEVAV